MVCEFWKTFKTLKSEVACKKTNNKNDVKEESNNPMTHVAIYLDPLFFLEIKNWETENNKDSQSARFPKCGAIYWIYITTF